MPKVKCPKCSSTNTTQIIYGLFDPNDQLEADVKNNKVYLGGCVISSIDPNRHCNNCKIDFDTPANKRRREKLIERGIIFE